MAIPKTTTLNKRTYRDESIELVIIIILTTCVLVSIFLVGGFI